MPPKAMRPQFVSQSNQSQFLSTSSLSGPPVLSQPPTLDVTGRQAQGHFQQLPRQGRYLCDMEHIQYIAL